MKRSAISAFCIGVVAMSLFAVLFVVAIVSEAWMRLRHGSKRETGAGIGAEEDYA